MIEISGALIELQSETPERLADFYVRLAHLNLVSSKPELVVLVGAGFTMRIKRGVPKDEQGGPVFGFVLTEDADIGAVRAHAVECGAVVLAEAKREGSRSLACTDPDGYEFSLSTSTTQLVGLQVVEAKASSPAPPAATPLVTGSGPRPATRRDIDRLRDTERLAHMQESIAGLHTPFTQDDPATAIDDMRAKLGPSADAERLAREEALNRAHAETKKLAADEMLAQYKKQFVDEEPSQAIEGSAGVLDVEDGFESDPPKRTLGGSADSTDDD